MKRLLLSLTAIAIVASLTAQTELPLLNGSAANLKVRQLQPHPDGTLYGGESVIGQKMFDNTIIGTTWYDVQSYTDLMQRVWAYPDGTVGATWMCAGQDLNPDRGTGYNYYNGGEWGTPNLHVGPSNRMGWPSYAPWGPNGEILAQYRYVAGEGPVQFYKRENKGEGEWVETILDPPSGYSIVWHSICTSGEDNEYIHVLAYTYDADYNGQTNALLYYRSSDGAETWDISELVIDGLGPDYFPGIHSLSYQWANPVGNTIAFTYAFDELGGWIFKSTDNGDNWQKIQVMETTLDPFNLPVDSDKIPCGSGTAAIVLDSEGSAHVVFGRMAKIYTGGDLFYYPFTDGLIYWNESMPVIDTTLISSYTMDYLYDAGMLCGWVFTDQPTYSVPDGQPNYSNGSCGFPQMSIDASDNIFIASSTLCPDFTNGEFIYRHIIANSTYDLGNSWVGMIDLNADIQYIFSECAYPAMAPFIDDYVHVVFQEDPYPGIHEWLENHDAVENNMMHMAIDKNVFVGIGEAVATSNIGLTTYPNPVSDQLTLGIELLQPGTLSMEVSNAIGQQVHYESFGIYPQGSHRISLDMSDLPAGIYYVVVSVDGSKQVKKVVVL